MWRQAIHVHGLTHALLRYVSTALECCTLLVLSALDNDAFAVMALTGVSVLPIANAVGSDGLLGLGTMERRY